MTTDASMPLRCVFQWQAADGKKIQIQLTGFMEKNTVKFMKELWTLLLSAQQNASGVPQQFLDAKEAEIQQRKVCLTKKYYYAVTNLAVTCWICYFHLRPITYLSSDGTSARLHLMKSVDRHKCPPLSDHAVLTSGCMVNGVMADRGQQGWFRCKFAIL